MAVRARSLSPLLLLEVLPLCQAVHISFFTVSSFLFNMVYGCGYTMSRRARLGLSPNDQCRICHCDYEAPEHLWHWAGLELTSSLSFDEFVAAVDIDRARTWLTTLYSTGVLERHMGDSGNAFLVTPPARHGKQISTQFDQDETVIIQ